MPKKKPNLDKFDKIIGMRIKNKRLQLGMRRKDLADKIGVTQQQTHKYELGTNRTSASMLYQIAEVLGTDISHFYKDLNTAPTSEKVNDSQRLYIELSKNFSKINNKGFKSAINNLVKTLANEISEEEALIAEEA